MYGQKHLFVKDAVNKDSTIQSDVRRFCLQVRRIQVPYQPFERSSHPVWTPICSCSIRLDDVPYRPDSRQISIIRSDDVFIPSGPYIVSRSFCASLHSSGCLSSPSGHPSVVDQLQILSKFRIREVDTSVRTMLVSCPDARATYMEIANSTSTVRTPALLGPDAGKADMEIAC
jgi:hypothetical protein